MIRFALTLEVGRVTPEPEPEIVPGLTDGDARVERADRDGPGWDRAGFGMPPLDPYDPEGRARD